MKRILLATMLALPSVVAVAQSDPMQMARVANANQVGVMEYCQGRSWADQAAVDAQRAAGSSLPPATDPAGMAAAEATGKSGQLLNNGTTMPLSEMARRTSTSEKDLCGKLADSAQRMAAQRRAMPSMASGMPQMPSMPNGMPAMPGGMAMPSMPGMPAMPGMPKSP